MIETTNSIPGATLRVWVACLNVAAVCLLASSARAQTPGAWPPGANRVASLDWRIHKE
jgi:hypothetical protein